MHACKIAKSHQTVRLLILPHVSLFPFSPSLFSLFFFFFFFVSQHGNGPPSPPWLASAKHPWGFCHRGMARFLRPGWACANVLQLPRHHRAGKIEIPFPLILHGIELCGGDTGPAMGFHCNRCPPVTAPGQLSRIFHVPPIHALGQPGIELTPPSLALGFLLSPPAWLCKVFGRRVSTSSYFSLFPLPRI